jgi:hypothetical protein
MMVRYSAGLHERLRAPAESTFLVVYPACQTPDKVTPDRILNRASCMRIGVEDQA